MTDNERVALAAVMGLQSAADIDGIMASVRQLQADAAGMEQVAHALGLEGGTVSAMIVTAQALREEIDILRVRAGRATELEAERRVSQARAEGKITASNEAWASALAAENPEVFDGWAASAPRVVPTETKVPASAGKPTAGEREREIERLCANEDVAAEANKARIDVKRYVDINLDSLREQYA